MFHVQYKKRKTLLKYENVNNEFPTSRAVQEIQGIDSDERLVAEFPDVLCPTATRGIRTDHRQNSGTSRLLVLVPDCLLIFLIYYLNEYILIVDKALVLSSFKLSFLSSTESQCYLSCNHPFHHHPHLF